MEKLEGGCSCGAVRYRLERAPMFVNCCHCRDCQRQSGAAFAVNAVIEADQVVLLSSEPQPVAVPTESGRPHQIFRCPKCQSPVWSEYNGNARARFIRVCSLDKPNSVSPNAHIYVRSKLPWISLPADVPAFEAFYDPVTTWPADSLKRGKAVFSR